MKKILFSLAAVAALVLSSCTKMDNNMNGVYQQSEAIGTEIKVTAMMAGETKASNAYTTKTDGLQSFNMYIWNGDASIVENAQFDKPGTGNASGLTYWSNGNNYYWSGSDTYSFVAFAIDDKFTNLTGITVAKDKIALGAGTVNSNTSEYTTTPKTGGIYADGSANSDYNQVDPVVAFTTGTKASPITTLIFNHTLSRIRVTAKASIASEYKLKVKFLGYEFRGVSVTAKDAEFKDGSITWTANGTTNVLDNRFVGGDKFSTATGIELASSVKDLDAKSWCNVIPCTNVAKTLVVKVALYDATTGDYIATRYLTTSAIINSVSEYKAGTQYTYMVEIKNNGGGDTDGGDPDTALDSLKITIITVKVEDWKDVDGGTATFGA